MFSVCKYVILGFILIANLAGLVQAEGANQTSSGSSLIAETVASPGPHSSNITTIVLPGESIQSAIQASLPGNIIEVHSGTYHENINVTKRLVIRGVDVGEGLPVVDVGGEGSAINITADGVRLENLVVMNASRFGAGINAGIKVTSRNCIIMGSSARYCFNGIALSNSDNNTLLNNNLSYNYNGILISTSTNDTLFSNNLSYNGNCINLSSSTNNTIFDNDFGISQDSGIHLESANKNTIFNNHFLGIKSGNCIEFYESSNNTLFGNNLSNNDNGISLYTSDNNTLRGNNLSNNDDGISLSESNNNTLLNNSLSRNHNGISLSESDNSTLLNNSLSLNDNGVDFSESDNNVLLGNNLSRNSEGIDLSDSDNNTLQDNNLSNNDYSGISLDSSDKNTISNNLFRGIRHGVGVGIDLSESRNNTIIGNNLSHNNNGITLYDSESNYLLGNNLSDNDNGISLSSSGRNSLSNNSMSENRYNFDMRGKKISDFDNDIDSTNLVNGRPIYYLKDAINKIIDPNSGMVLVGCFNCTNVTVLGLNESGSDASILLVNTHSSRVMENRLRNLENGIQLYFSDNNTISENNVSENNRGILLTSSNDNTVIGNNLSNNSDAVQLTSSNNNTFISNELSGNSNCIRFTSSNNNTLTSNDLRTSSHGIRFTSSDNNALNSNNLSNNSNGIELTTSDNNTLISNNLSKNDYGISLSSSRNNQLRENLMLGNRLNFNIDGSGISDFDNDIDRTNQINGRPIYYLRDANNETIDSNSNAGLVGCFNCTNITIRGLNISDTGTGIGLYKTNHSLVEYNNLTDLEEGIYLYFSNNNTIDSNIVNNSKYGIRIELSADNSVENNSVSNNTSNPIIYDEFRNNKFANNSENASEFTERFAPQNASAMPVLDDDVGVSNSPSEPVIGANSASPSHSLKSSDGGDSEGSGIEIPKQDLKKPTATEEIGKLIYSQIESLKWGQIVFTPPGKAWKGVPIPVEARISQNLSENISQGLEKFPKTERDKIRVSYEMNVQLDGGSDFDISPKVQEAKIIPESGYAEWDWSVTPLNEGTHAIKLTATATINLNENIAKEPDVKVFEKDIVVEVDWFGEAKKTIFGGINWIVLSFVGVLGLGLVNWLSGGILNRIKSMGKKEEKLSDKSEKTEVED